MSEHMFGVRRGRLTAAQFALRDELAKKHSVTFEYVSIPGTGPQSWFSCRGRGEPFDRATAAAVLDELHAREPGSTT